MKRLLHVLVLACMVAGFTWLSTPSFAMGEATTRLLEVAHDSHTSPVQAFASSAPSRADVNGSPRGTVPSPFGASTSAGDVHEEPIPIVEIGTPSTVEDGLPEEVQGVVAFVVLAVMAFLIVFVGRRPRDW